MGGCLGDFQFRVEGFGFRGSLRYVTIGMGEMNPYVSECAVPGLETGMISWPQQQFTPERTSSSITTHWQRQSEGIRLRLVF